MRRRSGTTPEPTVRAETADKGKDSAADGVQGDHAGQQEHQHHQGCAAFPGAVSVCNHDLGDADEKRNDEEHPAGAGEPPPGASEPGHA